MEHEMVKIYLVYTTVLKLKIIRTVVNNFNKVYGWQSIQIREEASKNKRKYDFVIGIMYWKVMNDPLAKFSQANDDVLIALFTSFTPIH